MGTCPGQPLFFPLGVEGTKCGSGSGDVLSPGAVSHSTWPLWTVACRLNMLLYMPAHAMPWPGLATWPDLAGLPQSLPQASSI